tara:strand:+ start:490 stop:1557 length:1068 start_codon:yes stop_codon:yes gene_type:complete
LNKEILKLNNNNQSVWIDSISREMINTGKLKSMVENGISGITSNPAIFQKALSNEDSYDEEIKQLTESGIDDPKKIFHSLSIKDISDACKILLPLYKKRDRNDGFVSIEIDPKFSKDTDKSIKEGIYLYESINQPNVMIKVPGTVEGIPVIEKLISLGINVNVTLLFNRDMYRKCANAYINGLKKINLEKIDIRGVNSVASFFISRIDTEVDKVIDHKNKGKVAIWNAIKAYEDYEDIFSKKNFKNILNIGGKAQKLLWASTSVKNPNYNKLMYVENLVAPNTVNTVPEDLYNEIINSENNYSSFKNLTNDNVGDTKITDNISLDNITGELLEVGIKLFEDAFDALIQEIKNKIS